MAARASRHIRGRDMYESSRFAIYAITADRHIRPFASRRERRTLLRTRTVCAFRANAQTLSRTVRFRSACVVSSRKEFSADTGVNGIFRDVAFASDMTLLKKISTFLFV